VLRYGKAPFGHQLQGAATCLVKLSPAPRRFSEAPRLPQTSLGGTRVPLWGRGCVSKTLRSPDSEGVQNLVSKVCRSAGIEAQVNGVS
jgi:hypothetical protein